MVSIIVAKFTVITAILSALFEAATHFLGQQKKRKYLALIYLKYVS